MGLPQQADPAVRQHHRPRVPELDHPERRRRPRRARASTRTLAFNPDSQGIGPTPRGYAVNLPAASFTSGIGISLGNILGSFNIDAALTALERQGRGRILSTPKVTTQNNQEAEIKQGVQIPIAIQQASGGASFAATNVQFKDAFLILKVTPQITDAGTVILKLEVENNSPDFANRVNGIPPINTQSAKTHRAGARRRHHGHRRHLPEQRADDAELDSVLRQAADPGSFVPQPGVREPQQRAVAVHHAQNHQGVREVRRSFAMRPAFARVALVALTAATTVSCGISPDYVQQDESQVILRIVNITATANGEDDSAFMTSDVLTNGGIFNDNAVLTVQALLKNPALDLRDHRRTSSSTATTSSTSAAMG